MAVYSISYKLFMSLCFPCVHVPGARDEEEEDSYRIGDGFVVLDVVAGPKPPSVPLGEYEQVCGLDFLVKSSHLKRKETTVLKSSMLLEVHA